MIKTKAKENKAKFPIWGMILAAVALLGLVIGIAITHSQSRNQPLPSEISVSEAVKLREQGAIILDVREQSEWEQLHIKGSTLIPLGELANRLNEIPTDKVVIVVCRTGHRSTQGRDILLGAGFENVTSMSGGITEWQAEGYQIVVGK